LFSALLVDSLIRNRFPTPLEIFNSIFVGFLNVIYENLQKFLTPGRPDRREDAGKMEILFQNHPKNCLLPSQLAVWSENVFFHPEKFLIYFSTFFGRKSTLVHSLRHLLNLHHFNWWMFTSESHVVIVVDDFFFLGTGVGSVWEVRKKESFQILHLEYNVEFQFPQTG